MQGCSECSRALKMCICTPNRRPSQRPTPPVRYKQARWQTEVVHVLTHAACPTHGQNCQNCWVCPSAQDNQGTSPSRYRGGREELCLESSASGTLAQIEGLS